jgi:hypothetical protein
MSNSPWPTKRTALIEHGLLLLNKQLEQMHEWNEDLIDARCEQLATEILALWPGPDSAVWGPVAAATSN